MAMHLGQRTQIQYPDRRDHVLHNDRALGALESLFLKHMEAEPRCATETRCEAIVGAFKKRCHDVVVALLTVALVITWTGEKLMPVFSAFVLHSQWLWAPVAWVAFSFPMTVGMMRHSWIFVLFCLAHLLHPRLGEVVLFMEQCTRPCVLLACSVIVSSCWELPCVELGAWNQFLLACVTLASLRVQWLHCNAGCCRVLSTLTAFLLSSQCCPLLRILCCVQVLSAMFAPFWFMCILCGFMSLEGKEYIWFTRLFRFCFPPKALF